MVYKLLNDNSPPILKSCSTTRLSAIVILLSRFPRVFKLISCILIELLFEISAINSIRSFEPYILFADNSRARNTSPLKSEAYKTSFILTSLLKTIVLCKLCILDTEISSTFKFLFMETSHII